MEFPGPDRNEIDVEIDDVFLMAACAECGPPALPWYDADERDRWVTAHTEATGHHVSLHTEMRGRGSRDDATTLHFYPLTEIPHE